MAADRNDRNEQEIIARECVADALGAVAQQLTPEQVAAVARSAARRFLQRLGGVRIALDRRHPGYVIFLEEWEAWTAKPADKRGRFQTGRVAERAQVTRQAVQAWIREKMQDDQKMPSESVDVLASGRETRE